MDLRITLDEAVGEERLLAPFWRTLSLPQQTVIRAFYGLPLSADQDEWGFSALDYYAMLTGHARYDALGNLLSVERHPYLAKRYPELWLVLGVRAGKSHLAAFLDVYEAVCGGHEQYVAPGKKAIIFQIAQDMRLARMSLHTIRAILQTIPFITGSADGAQRIRSETADSIELWNGCIIACVPPSVRSVRGYDSPGATLDEIAVWYNEKESANPDREIYTQVLSRQAQFPNAWLAALSSPWMKQGLLWEAHRAGSDEHRLVLHTTTAGLRNPLVTPGWLERRRSQDLRVFARECLAEFQDSLSGFLDPQALQECVDASVRERPPLLHPAPGEEQPFYTAAMDPAFRQDAFAFTLVHTTARGTVVQDVVRRWLPTPGTVLDPARIIEELADLCRRYQVTTIYSDQYQMEALNQLAFQHGLMIERVPFSAASKAAIFGSLKVRVGHRQVRLLDDPDQLQELRSLEQQRTEGGTIRIGAPKGQHDDLASALALALHKATWMLADLAPQAQKEPTLFELGMATLQSQNRRRAQALEEMGL